MRFLVFLCNRACTALVPFTLVFKKYPQAYRLTELVSGVNASHAGVSQLCRAAHDIVSTRFFVTFSISSRYKKSAYQISQLLSKNTLLQKTVILISLISIHINCYKLLEATITPLN